MRDCHNSAIKKSLYFQLSVPPVDPLFTITLPTFFLRLEEFPSPCTCGLTKAYQGHRPQIEILLLIPNKAILAGEVTGSLF